MLAQLDPFAFLSPKLRGKGVDAFEPKAAPFSLRKPTPSQARSPATASEAASGEGRGGPGVATQEGKDQAWRRPPPPNGSPQHPLRGHVSLDRLAPVDGVGLAPQHDLPVPADDVVE